MTAKLEVEIDIKLIRKFAALSDIDLTAEEEKKITDSTTHVTGAEFNELAKDKNASLIFAGLIIVKQLKDK